MDITIIGGGIGGLTAGALLTKDGYNVTVLEASNEWGGSAGKFSRKDYLFPVGATMGMGFEEGGVHHRIFDELGLSIPFVKLDEIMRVYNGSSVMPYYADRNRHLAECTSQFPDHAEAIVSFYQEVWKIGAEIRKLIKPLPVLPPVTITEWRKLLFSVNIGTPKLLPYLRKTMGDLLKKHHLHEAHAFRHFIDGQLIDSMQATSGECSALMGALALDIYHEGAYYTEGGLFSIAEKLQAYIEEHGGKTFKRKHIQTIRREKKKWVVVDQRGENWRADHLICNLPVQSFVPLLSEPLQLELPNKLQKRSRISQWGAFTMYLAIEENVIPEYTALFNQVLVEGGTMTEGDHLFLSLSSSKDRIRAPQGYRTLTVSTHTELHRWDTKEKYDQYKAFLTEKVLSGVERVIPEVRSGIDMMMAGAPRAWERFTKRPNGMVGGFPQTNEFSLFNSLSHRTGLDGLWLCGDSVFPGAGTIGVSTSGYHVYQSIAGKR
ncbi:FAD-dependent oxidoreductase [Alkalihalobacillus sp. CinArs1]|uniref:FAD-dependent oxidoreductase n=1 Tax=Alkalihalobacillus sp. CinArs1 TaxID=2995314 RepID=UPI0022DD343D|nr:FAD-dependent oxidoreductase [Alkalihalobacillus sp. CinArs1]